METAQDALKSFLKTLLGREITLQAEAPEPHAPADLPTADYAVTAHSAEHGVAVLLEEAWVPLLSEAMLGTPMQPTDDEAGDLMNELVGQGYGAVRNALASEDLQLPNLTLDVTFEEPDWTPPESLQMVRFTAEGDAEPIGGLVVFPAGALPQETEETVDSGAESSSPEASPSDDAPEDPVDVSPASFSELGQENVGGDGTPENFDLLAGVELEVTVELGRRRLPLADVLQLTNGSVIELEKLVGEPLEIYANGRFIAEGEAVVIDEQFGVRITSIASKRQRNKAFF